MDDTFNDLSAKVYARGKDTPGRRWWHLDTWHPAIGRALRISREGPEAFYACMPFRLTRAPDRTPLISIAYPTPHIFTDVEDWLGIETVLHWNPVTNTVEIDGDTGAQLVGKFSPAADRGTIYADPRAFFQDWCRQRAQFYVQRQASIHNHWTAPLVERDDVPGVLVVGGVDKIRWPVHQMPEVLNCVGIDPTKINRALMKSARIPRAQNSLKAVA